MKGLIYTFKNDFWHIEVWEKDNGRAHIKRIKCPEPLEPKEWDSPDRTPKEWVELQANFDVYMEET